MVLASLVPFLISVLWFGQSINNIHYVTESRIEWCSSEGQPQACFLFARKFTRGAAFRFLDLEAGYENVE